MGVLQSLGASTLRLWCRTAAAELSHARDEIDALNVFPVPDGDTGTNLHLTMRAAAEAAEVVSGVDAGHAYREVTRAVLLGARGNSGVIVSQVLRGLAREVLARAGPWRGRVLADGLSRGAGLAYAAVAHPVEGTVLSVAAGAGEAANRSGGDDLPAVARAAAEGARMALERTRDQLDVLSRAGVVDAGGAGLCVIFDALASVVTDGEYNAGRLPLEAPSAPVRQAPAAPGPGRPAGYDGPAYEVMYLLATDPVAEGRGDCDAVAALRSGLDALGDSLVIVGGDGLWNVHVHTDEAGAAIEAGLAAGRPHRLRVSYLRGEGLRAPVRGRGVVAVAAGRGVAALFGDAGATVVRRERDDVAPAEVLGAVRESGDEVTLLPNDRALHALAEVVAERARSEGVHVSVVPTTSCVEGLAATAVHDPARRADEDVIAMTAAAGATRTAAITVAARRAVTSAGICRAGDVLGLVEGDVVVIGSDPADVACQVVDRMLLAGGELVTLITGEQAATGVAERVRAHLHATRPDVDSLVYDGGQAGCQLLVGVE